MLSFPPLFVDHTVGESFVHSFVRSFSRSHASLFNLNPGRMTNLKNLSVPSTGADTAPGLKSFCFPLPFSRVDGDGIDFNRSSCDSDPQFRLASPLYSHMIRRMPRISDYVSFWFYRYVFWFCTVISVIVPTQMRSPQNVKKNWQAEKSGDLV